MINEGIHGLDETITFEIQGNQINVNRHLKRRFGDAAIPPNHSVEFQFYVAELPFATSIHGAAPSIITDETIGVAGPGTEERSQGFDIPLELDRNMGTKDLTSIGSIARMRGFDVSVFGDVFRDDIGKPPIDPPDGPDRDIPFEITLTPPNGLPQMVFTNPKYSQIKQVPSADGRPDPVLLDKGRGLWKIRIRNINSTAKRIFVEVRCKHALAPIQQKTLPLSLFSSLMDGILKKALPTIAVADGSLVVSTPTHFLGLAGVDTEFSIPGIAGALTFLIDAFPTFSPMTAAIESRPALVSRISARRLDLQKEYDAQILEAQRRGDRNTATIIDARKRKALNACDASIQQLNLLAANKAVFCIVVAGMFSDTPISLLDIGFLDLDVALMANKFPAIALIFDDRMQLSEVITTVAVDLSPALTKVALTAGALVVLSAHLMIPILNAIGIATSLIYGVKFYNSINDLDVEARIRERILERRAVISHYVKGAFERVTAIGASVVKCALIPNGATDGTEALRVFYFDPGTLVPPRPMRPFDDVITDGTDTVVIPPGAGKPRPPTAIVVGGSNAQARAPEQRVSLSREAPGPLPRDFVVRRPETLGLLDQHASIVVLMMENRSFDHYFHDLAATFPGRGYSAVPSNFTNTASPGFGEPFKVMKLTDIGIGHSLIFPHSGQSFDPSHAYEATKSQIGVGTGNTLTGEMNGFARDFSRQSDSPQIVMGYFGLDSLPTYRVLADYYSVCDRWFASLPVGTHPNRLSALQGNVPVLHNFKAHDPAIGYLEDYSIFDLLNTQGISWKVFESDIATIRLYDRFRLDVSNVRPIRELETTLKSGQLPRVMFIEPQFLYGNDDHPPMSVKAGQNFVKRIIEQFIDADVLDRVLFLLTYDEHGGFFDHVPPPGTERGPAEWKDRVASLFITKRDIGAPTSMGVRVPSMLMSKFASNNAKHEVLDHTSILKTILLHNRLQISTAQFSRFGNRVKFGTHLGELLDMQTPRAINYDAMLEDMNTRSGASGFTASPTMIVGRDLGQLDREHPAQVLRGIARPRTKRFIAERT